MRVSLNLLKLGLLHVLIAIGQLCIAPAALTLLSIAIIGCGGAL